MSNEELQVQIDTFMKQGFKPTSPAVSGLTQGGRTSPEGYRKSYEAQGYTPRYGNENAMDLKEGDRIRSSVIIPSQGKIDSDRGAEEDFRDLMKGSDARIMGEIARRQNMPGGGNDWRMAALKGEMTKREYRKKSGLEQEKRYREEDEYHRKAIEEDRKRRDLQDIESKLRRFQGPSGYNMPQGTAEIVPGTGIYQTEPSRPGFHGGFSNIGVTEQPRTLTPAEQKEVQALQERQKWVEAMGIGKLYEPKIGSETKPTALMQNVPFFAKILGISEAEAAKQLSESKGKSDQDLMASFLNSALSTSFTNEDAQQKATEAFKFIKNMGKPEDKTLTPEIAKEYLKKHGNREAAEKAAKEDGYKW